jgi:serine protease Do
MNVRALPLVFLALAVPVHAQQKPAPSSDPLVRMNESIDALTRKVWPSVVQIQVSGYGAREGSRADTRTAVVGPQSSTGSGFVIDPDGYVMTNAHVVSGARRVEVVLPAENADGSLSTALSGKSYTLPARIVGIATELDLALLKLDGQKLPALPLASYSQIRQGETVFAFGSPIGMRNSLTHGLISAVARQVDVDSPLIYVQTDAPINPGNSGGPLVNIRGEVVGINTFILSQSGGAEGLGFAIPSATIRTVFRQLKQYGVVRRQEIGASFQTITPDMADSLGLVRNYGVIVSDVWPRGPAEAAGLKVGDLLLSMDGQAVDNLPTV